MGAVKGGRGGTREQNKTRLKFQWMLAHFYGLKPEWIYRFIITAMLLFFVDGTLVEQAPL